MELTRFERAALKRVQKNSAPIRRKMEALKVKAQRIMDEYNALKQDYDAIEGYVITKYGYPSTEILNGTAGNVQEALEETAENVEEVVDTEVENEVSPF